MQPNVQNILNGWQQSLILYRVTQSHSNDGLITNIEVPIIFKGVVQTLQPEKLQVKPEETRSSKWLQIHTKTSFTLKTNDIIEYNSKRYKVLDILDYSINGYYEYHAVEDF
tara:strand:- start:14514 stop:14846 length:333 start_codon:yes stop_codon:yes gene_type:complete